MAFSWKAPRTQEKENLRVLGASVVKLFDRETSKSSTLTPG
jgi:hypothetical protein